MSCGPDRVAVLGGGIAGLGAAVFLARRGYLVDVFEGDPVDGPRRGAPQAGQSHAFVARCRQILAAEAPEVLDTLREAGAQEIRLDADPPPALTGPVEADPDLVVLAASRPAFEAALRQVAAAEPFVRMHHGRRVTGLLTDGGAVRGLEVDGGEALAAAHVIDAGGRRSPVADWTGGTAEVVPCGISYCSRFFRRRPGVPSEPLNRGYLAGGSFDRYSCLVFPAEAGTFSVTFGFHPADKELRGLQDDDTFLAAAAAIPMVAPWVDPDRAEPLRPVAAMHGLVNRLAAPPPLAGLLPVGDALLITNPAHTRGTTLALLSALLAARAVVDHPVDPRERAAALAAAYRRELEPWYHDSIAQDAARLSRWRPEDVPAPTTTADPGSVVTNGEAFAAAQRDPVVWRAFTRAQQLLELPAAVLGDPAIVRRVRAVQASGWAPPSLAGPSHDELVEIVGREPVAVAGR